MLLTPSSLPGQASACVDRLLAFTIPSPPFAGCDFGGDFCRQGLHMESTDLIYTTVEPFVESTPAQGPAADSPSGSEKGAVEASTTSPGMFCCLLVISLPSTSGVSEQAALHPSRGLVYYWACRCTTAAAGTRWTTADHGFHCPRNDWLTSFKWVHTSLDCRISFFQVLRLLVYQV